MKFEYPEIELVKFSVMDILTASSGSADDDFTFGEDELPDS